MVRDTLIHHISASLQNLGLPEHEIVLDHPALADHGDYSTNIALQLKTQNSKLLDAKNPREIASKIVAELEKDEELKKLVSKIEIAGPGFINFWLKTEYLVTSMIYIIEVNDSFGKLGQEKGKKVIIEYTDPNPFKEFHIGHLYSNIVGESIARLYEASGAAVKRACYQGDVGMHVAKSLWGLNNPVVVRGDELEKMSLSDGMKVLGQAYARGTAAYDGNEEAKKEIKQLNKQIYEGDSSIKSQYDPGRRKSLHYFGTIYKRLGTKFDYFFFESETGQIGKEVVHKHRDIFEESEGAVVFRGDKYGLHTRVFINSQGLPTYEAKDLGLPFLKKQKFPYDISIIITGNEVNEYFKVVLKALELIDPVIEKKTRHISHGMVRFPQGKMSSRTGNIVTGESLIEEVKKRIAGLIRKDNSDSDVEKEHIAEGTAIGAIKYSLLKVSIGSDVVFDINDSISFDGNSGPYLQYTYARCKSVLNKSEEQGVKESRDQKYELAQEELAVVRTLYKFPEVVLEAGKNFAPSLICNFLYDLSQKYNLFYQKVPILNSSEAEKKFRLALTAATAHVLKNGLNLLGIPILEKM